MPKRKHPRLSDYDYSTPGAYFITICTKDKRCLLGNIVGRGLAPAEERLDCVSVQMIQSAYGTIAEKQLLLLEQRYPLLKVDQYVIMPNHIHAIMILEPDTAGASPRPTIPQIVGAYKSLTTKACKQIQPIEKLFQTSFYEHVIRGREDYEEIASYIQNNPMRWQIDKLYCE